MHTHFIANWIKIQTRPSPLQQLPFSARAPYATASASDYKYVYYNVTSTLLPTITHLQDFHLCFSSNKCGEDSRARSLFERQSEKKSNREVWERDRTKKVTWFRVLPSSYHCGKVDLNPTVSSGNQYGAYGVILPEEWEAGIPGTPTLLHKMLVESLVGGVNSLSLLVCCILLTTYLSGRGSLRQLEVRQETQPQTRVCISLYFWGCCSFSLGCDDG